MLHSFFGVAVAIVLNTVMCNIRPTDAGCGDFKGLQSESGKLYIPLHVDVVVPNDGSYLLYSDVLTGIEKEEVEDIVCREEYIEDGISYMAKGYIMGNHLARPIIKELVCQDNIHTSRRYVWERKGIVIGMSTVTFYDFSSPLKSVNIRGYYDRDTIFVTRRVFPKISNLSFWNVTKDHHTKHDLIFMWNETETGNDCKVATTASDNISPYVKGQLLFIKFKMNNSMTGKYQIIEQNMESSGPAKLLSIHFGVAGRSNPTTCCTSAIAITAISAVGICRHLYRL